MAVVEQLIERYQLQPHPEGGWYREVHRSTLQVRRSDGQARSAFTQILFLLQAPAVSRWHRVSQADETWLFISGEPLELQCLPARGGTPTITRLGFNLSDPGLTPLAVVPAECWQAARCLGAWSLVSCAVGPGFSFSDFSLLADQPLSRHPSGASQELL
ncbi:MAG: cupin domain-containing protein [Vulcanococcus sp.]